jgi:hypothetical protein
VRTPNPGAGKALGYAEMMPSRGIQDGLQGPRTRVFSSPRLRDRRADEEVGALVVDGKGFRDAAEE